MSVVLVPFKVKLAGLVIPEASKATVVYFFVAKFMVKV